MPHAVSMPQTGFQALILCGPGGSLNTFTTVPSEYPKALIPIANRPMVWYVLDWCYRMGVTNLTLITPPESQICLSAALAQNPYLTSLPSPSPTILAPVGLSHETATAELLRLPEVQASIISDFMLLPCDLVCEVPGEAFLECWMGRLSRGMAAGGTATCGSGGQHGTKRRKRDKGGLSVWYPTANRAESVKDEECDFLASVALHHQDNQHHASYNNLSGHGTLGQLVLTLPSSTLNEKTESQRGWRLRASLLRKYGAVKCLTRFRDAHVYFFPHWVKEFAMWNAEESDDNLERLEEDEEGKHKKSFRGFENVSEDLVGTWAKMGWRKDGFKRRFGGQGSNRGSRRKSSGGGGGRENGMKEEEEEEQEEEEDDDDGIQIEATATATAAAGSATRGAGDVSSVEIPIEEEIDLISLSSTQVTRYSDSENRADQEGGKGEKASSLRTVNLASRVPATTHNNSSEDSQLEHGNRPSQTFPPILSYIHSSDPCAPLIRRVDSTALLLTVSLAIARLPTLDDVDPTSTSSSSTSTKQAKAKANPSPLSHQTRIASTTTPPTKTSYRAESSLIDHNVLIGEHTSLDESVIGSSCRIGVGTAIRGSVIMDGAVVGDRCRLDGCVVGKKAWVGDGCVLKGCEVQDGNAVVEATEAVEEKFLVGGLEDDEDQHDDEDQDEDEHEHEREDEVGVGVGVTG